MDLNLPPKIAGLHKLLRDLRWFFCSICRWLVCWCNQLFSHSLCQCQGLFYFFSEHDGKRSFFNDFLLFDGFGINLHHSIYMKNINSHLACYVQQLPNLVLEKETVKLLSRFCCKCRPEARKNRNICLLREMTAIKLQSREALLCLIVTSNSVHFKRVLLSYVIWCATSVTRCFESVFNRF